MCSGDQSLGKAIASFQGLLSEQETLAVPAVIEGMFPLVPPGSSHQLSGAPQDTEPGVGVSVSLRLDQQDVIGNAPSASSPILSGGQQGIAKQVPECKTFLISNNIAPQESILGEKTF